MARKRLTQLFPFLIPLRKKQKTICFYRGMQKDKNTYSKNILPGKLPYELFQTSSLLINQSSGQDIQYQYNKAYNLHLAAQTLNGLVIYPGEVFSFWWLVRYADRYLPYKPGLNLIDGKLVGTYGGGMCQLSNLLFWLFLHSPLTILERHGHGVEAFPSTTPELPHGTDATVSEGWLDLKVKNNTEYQYQLDLNLDDEFLYGSLLVDALPVYAYRVFNDQKFYFKKSGRVLQTVSVSQQETNLVTGKTQNNRLYSHTCEIGYALPQGTVIS